MTLAAYNGHEALTFNDYLDLGTGKTLHAEPGEVYDVAPASGRVIPDLPEPWFTPVYATGGIVTAGMTAEGALEPGFQAEPDGDFTAGTEHPDDPEG